MTIPRFFLVAVAVLLLLQCCSCVAFDSHALPESSAILNDADRRHDGRRAEIDTFSLDGFLDDDEDGDGDGDGDFDYEDTNTHADNADATEEVVDEIVDLLQRNIQQKDADQTREPSDFPTGIPETDEPTASPTSVDTDAPTPVPTDDPTPEPTEEPTSVPTSAPTSTPTHVPTSTDEPTNELTAFRYEEEVDGAEYEGSSNAATTLPSLISPTASPTILEPKSSSNATILSPSAAGLTNSPVTATNSSAITSEPTTVSPTKVPTTSPTPNPSSNPTTASPTFSPTPACHDKRTYRSPINGLGCEQHVGSDCERWRHIGLTKEQVVELHNECPVACGTDCEIYTLSPTAAPTAAPTASPTHSLKNVVAFLELYMYGASGPMSIDTRRNLEEALQLYFEAKLDASDATGSSDMTSVTIADQGAIGGTNEAPVIVAKERSNKMMMRKRRRMEDEKLNLKVKIIAEATTRHLDSAMFKALLQGAINDVETLSSVLLEADGYFAGVMMSDNMIEELNRADGEAAKPEESKTPTAAIVVSSIGVIAVGGFLTGHFLFRRQYDDRKVRKNNIHAFFTFSPKEGYIPDEEGGYQPDLADLKGSGSIFSFEESPVHCLPENDATMKAPGLLGSRSQSTASGSESNSGSNPSLPLKMADDQAIIVSPPNSPENLMAGIPPMIVIDNIDQAEDGVDNTGNDDENGVPPQSTASPSKSLSPRRKSNLPKADKNGIPIRRIEASSAIAKALSNNNNGNGKESEVTGSTKEPTLMEMIRNVKSIEDEDEGDVRSPASSSRQCLSPTFERVWNDGDSVSSMPDVAAVNVNLDKTRLKKSHSTNEVIDVEPSKALNAFIQKEWAHLGLSPTSQKKAEDQDNVSDSSVGPTYHQNLFASDSDIESGSAPAEQPPRHVRKDSKLKNFVSSLTHFSNHSRDSSRLSGSSSPSKLSPRKRDLRAVEEAPHGHAEQAASIASSDYGSEARDTFDYDARPGLFSMSMARFERKMNKIGQKYQSKKDDAWKINTGASGSDVNDERNANDQGGVLRSHSSDLLRDSEIALAIPKLANSANNINPHSPVRQMTKMRSSSFSPQAPPAAIVASQNQMSNLRRSRNDNDGFEYVFEAPSNGKLGIIIHKTVVHTVKDYSPLFGMVEPGDRILQIDDIITDNMSTGEVTRVLTSKRTGKNRNNHIRLTIFSTTEKRGLKTSDKESIVVPAAFVKKTKQVTINTDAPVSTFIYTNRTGSSEEDEVDDNSHLTSDQSTPQHSDFGGDDDNGDAGFHLLGAYARSEDEEDEDVAIHLLGSMYSSGASGEEEEITTAKARMDLEGGLSYDKEKVHEYTESEQRTEAEEECSAGNSAEESSFNHMIIMDAGTDESSEGTSVDFEDFR